MALLLGLFLSKDAGRTSDFSVENRKEIIVIRIAALLGDLCQRELLSSGKQLFCFFDAQTANFFGDSAAVELPTDLIELCFAYAQIVGDRKCIELPSRWPSVPG